MKTVVEMAEDVGAYVADLPLEDAVLFEVDILSGRSAKLEAFAALVRAEAQAEEREACAKVCDANKLIAAATNFEIATANKCAKAIRARGNT